jgi:hypothetical protein
LPWINFFQKATLAG